MCKVKQLLETMLIRRTLSLKKSTVIIRQRLLGNQQASHLKHLMVRVILQGRRALINLLSCKDRDQRLLSWVLTLIRPNKEVDTSLGNLSVILSRRRLSLAHLLRKTQRIMACILMKRLAKFLAEIKSGRRNRDKWERLSINSVASPQKQ